MMISANQILCSDCKIDLNYCKAKSNVMFETKYTKMKLECRKVDVYALWYTYVKVNQTKAQIRNLVVTVV